MAIGTSVHVQCSWLLQLMSSLFLIRSPAANRSFSRQAQALKQDASQMGKQEMTVSLPHCASIKLGGRMRACCLLLQVNGDSDANACSYGETSRSAIRGGPWIATVADFPQSALYVSFTRSASHFPFVA